MRWSEAEWRGDAHTYGRPLTVYQGRIILPALVWHTTETGGIPGYQGGYTAPHFTAYVAERRWIQHADTEQVVGTLKGWSASGGPTNHANVIQCEIIGFSAWWLAIGPGRVAVKDLDDSQIRWLSRLPIWLSSIGVLRDTHAWAEGWTGVSKINELSWPEWLYGRDRWTQVGHAMVPDLSKHWDPGGLDRDRLIRFTNQGVKDEETMRLGDEGQRVAWAQHRLNLYADAGIGSGGLKVDKKFGAATEQAVKDWQAHWPHLDEDGVLTALDIDRLRRRP